MSFRVYISHSVAPHELGAIYGVAELAARKGMEPILPDRRWQAVMPPPRLAQLLTNLDAFVVVATILGQDLECVNRELSAALQSGLNPQNVVSVVDQGITPPLTEAVLITEAVLTINRSNLAETVAEAVRVLERLQLERSQQNLLVGLVVGGLVALLLASKE